MENWKTLNTETVFEASPYLLVTKQQVEIRPGTVVDDFYQVKLRPFAVCVPFLENGRILALRQYKHVPARISITFPAGYVEPGEAPLDSCERELLEETGYQVSSLHHLGEFTDNGNQRGCVGNYFVAQQCRKVQDACSGDLEEMELLDLSPQELDRALLDGSMAITHHGFAWSMTRVWLGLQSEF